MKKAILLGVVGLCILQTSIAQPLSGDKLKARLRENLALAQSQYKLLHANIPADRMPQNYDIKTGTMKTSDVTWWCSGFFPGTLWYLFEYGKDKEIRAIAETRLRQMEPMKHYTGNHDLGFMMYCSFGNAYRITGNPAYKTTIDTAAMSLATRYRPQIQSIQSWDSSKNFRCAVIVDNMMNLELLMWAAAHGGSPRLREIAITHANTTMERHFRPDNAAFHVLDYTLGEGGRLLRKTTWQGYSDSSAWSRGQAWALYGYSSMYRLSGDRRYLDQARKLAAFILDHPRLPKDGIPYWDFDAPTIPNTLRDASAGSILASAFLEMSGQVKGREGDRYLRAAENILTTLSTDTYLAAPGTNGGFLLKHSVGALPLKGEVDVALTYADYYFVEAMMRYLAR
ncbi:MAG: glucuronyl hydrolase [Chitinophagia bacterium]|nr:glucuronyl hydrolase [Chitinophagia bacterium]